MYLELVLCLGCATDAIGNGDYMLESDPANHADIISIIPLPTIINMLSACNAYLFVEDVSFRPTLYSRLLS